MVKITTIKRNGVEVKIGYGVLTKNPTEVTERDFRNYRGLVKVYYDGHWYNVGKFSTTDEVIDYIKKHQTYTKEQLFELIYNIVV